MCSKVFLAQLLGSRLPVAQKVPLNHLQFSSINLFISSRHAGFSIQNRGWSGELQLTHPGGTSIFLLVSDLSQTGFIWYIVVLVLEKTCSWLTFLALISFPSCPSHLSLKGSCLSNYSSHRSCFITKNQKKNSLMPM